MSEPEYEIVMPQQKVRCTLAEKEKGEPYMVEVTKSPKVKFKDSKATEARSIGDRHLRRFSSIR